MSHLLKSTRRNIMITNVIYVERLGISKRIVQNAKIGLKRKGFITTRTTRPNEKFVFMGNRVKVPVEAVGTYRLILDTGHHLDLFETLYVPNISRNLVSLSKLDVGGYSFKFGNECFSLRSSHLDVIGYSNSDFAGCIDTRKSTFGYVYLLVGGAISWKSAKQTVIVASTMEAEFVACFEATVHAKWLRNFISGLGLSTVLSNR
ncbi:PREDICTED: uncharacterized protein LOC109341527 [Lupinus angustifolius]|uniref:uncharacterized protein LOC109341527 n=1 Tax=Lupinus angustifolius TaxID=3871 RepID=UPI00092E2061|nr:PREDICTED: uncharacterized protein LOC109341527 [Lupinus angustifolius]